MRCLDLALQKYNLECEIHQPLLNNNNDDKK